MGREVDLIYKGSDNINALSLKVDGISQDLSDVTQIDLIFSDGVKVSNTTGTAYPIKWLNTGETGKVELQVGGESLTLGDLTASLTTFDAINDDGIIWSGQNGINFYVTQAT